MVYDWIKEFSLRFSSLGKGRVSKVLRKGECKRIRIYLNDIASTDSGHEMFSLFHNGVTVPRNKRDFCQNFRIVIQSIISGRVTR